jgi:hypothetical protein
MARNRRSEAQQTVGMRLDPVVPNVAAGHIVRQFVERLSREAGARVAPCSL